MLELALDIPIDERHPDLFDTTLTPLALIRSLGGFDFDPCGWEAHPTATKIIQLPTNGLAVPWLDRVWLNPVCGCGVQPMLGLSANEEMSSVQEQLPAHRGMVCQTSGSGSAIPNVMVPSVREGTCEGQTSSAQSRPQTQSEAVRGKGASSEERKREAEKAPTNTLRQSHSPRPPSEVAVAMDADGLGIGKGDVESPLRILPNGTQGIDTRPLHSTQRSEMSGNDTEQHGSSVQLVQSQQGRQEARTMVEGQRAHCPNCGAIGYTIVKTTRVFLNPPYSFVDPWLERMSAHVRLDEGSGVTLLLASTDTAWFHNFIVPVAAGLCFPKGRIEFEKLDGRKITLMRASMMVGWTQRDMTTLRNADIGACLDFQRR